MLQLLAGAPAQAQGAYSQEKTPVELSRLLWSVCALQLKVPDRCKSAQNPSPKETQEEPAVISSAVGTSVHS